MRQEKANKLPFMMEVKPKLRNEYMIKLIKFTLPIASMLFVFGGCSTFPDSECMKSVLVSAESRTPLYPVREGDTRSVSITNFKGGCGGASPDLPGKEGEFGINMTLTAPEGKRSSVREKRVVFPVFVALLDNKDNVLDRLDEKVEVTIDDHAVNHSHKITYRLPTGISINSTDHRLLVGFNGGVTEAYSSKAHTHHKRKPLHKKRLKKPT